MKRKLVFLLPLVALLIGLLPLVVSAAGPWSDNFDSYTPGQVLDNVNGWKGWGGDPNAAGVVTDTFASSAPNSLYVDGQRDAVREFSDATSGLYVFDGEIYFDAAFFGQHYLIFLNSYDDGGATNNWSVQVCFDSVTATLYDDPGAGCSSASALPMVFDAWVPWRLEIDLDANMQSFYYNGALLYTDSWTEHVSGGGALNIGAIDLWSNGATAVYYDNFSLIGPNQITFDKTVGTDPNTCAATDSITIDAGYGGTEVTYCYRLTNTGTNTVTYHTVEDSELGTVLGPNFVLDVAPGGTVPVTTTVLITETTVNTATWYINDAAGATVYSATDSATVTRGAPTDVSLSGFGVTSGIDSAMIWLGVLLVAVVGLGFALRRKVTA